MKATTIRKAASPNRVSPVEKLHVNSEYGTKVPAPLFHPLRLVARCGREGTVLLHIAKAVVRIAEPRCDSATMVKFEQRMKHMMKAKYAAPVSSADPRMLVDRIADGSADRAEAANIVETLAYENHPSYRAAADHFLNNY